jgi:hypothetical protein
MTEYQTFDLGKPHPSIEFSLMPYRSPFFQETKDPIGFVSYGVSGGSRKARCNHPSYTTPSQNPVITNVLREI